MDEQNAEVVNEVATQLVNAIGDDFKWEWDDRFNGGLTQFEKSNAPRILDVLSRLFVHEWTVTNIDSAEEPVLIATDFLGGLRSGQRLYTTRMNSETMCIAAYWPWGDGNTISVRVIPFVVDAASAKLAAVSDTFRRVFSLRSS